MHGRQLDVVELCDGRPTTYRGVDAPAGLDRFGVVRLVLEGGLVVFDGPVEAAEVVLPEPSQAVVLAGQVALLVALAQQREGLLEEPDELGPALLALGQLDQPVESTAMRGVEGGRLLQGSTFRGRILTLAVNLRGLPEDLGGTSRIAQRRGMALVERRERVRALRGQVAASQRRERVTVGGVSTERGFMGARVVGHALVDTHLVSQ